MTPQEHDAVMEAVTEAVLEDRMLATKHNRQELIYASIVIRRAVARKLNMGQQPPTTA